MQTRVSPGPTRKGRSRGPGPGRAWIEHDRAVDKSNCCIYVATKIRQHSRGAGKNGRIVGRHRDGPSCKLDGCAPVRVAIFDPTTLRELQSAMRGIGKGSTIVRIPLDCPLK